MAKPKSPKNNGAPKERPANIRGETEAGIMQAEATSEVLAETTKTTARRTTRKSEPRANLVPISLDEEIRSLAYLLSERRGFEPGHETEDWLNAEREVLERYHQQRA
jgi:hypothetical protein